MNKSLVFSLQRNSSVSLTEQTANGLRRAILTGEYKPGDSLPSLIEMADLLEVSHMVTRGAVQRLKREGFITARPRAGIIVCDPAVQPWRGQLLHLSWSSSAMYYHSVLSGTLAERLQGENILFESIFLSAAEAENGFPRVRTALASGTWNLALLENFDTGVADLLKAHQVPFVHLHEKVSQVIPNPEAAAHIESNRLSAWTQAADHAAKCAVRSVLLLVPGADEQNIRQLLVDRGMACKTLIVERDPDLPSPICVEHGAFHAFASYLDKSPRLPDLLIFTDDFIARGALLSLIGRGLRIPEDVQVITWANYGLGPLYYEPLTRVEADAGRDGEMIAKFLLQHLRRDKSASPCLLLQPQFVLGRSTVADGQ